MIAAKQNVAMGTSRNAPNMENHEGIAIVKLLVVRSDMLNKT
jgi:hypothetical protein